MFLCIVGAVIFVAVVAAGAAVRAEGRTAQYAVDLKAYEVYQKELLDRAKEARRQARDAEASALQEGVYEYWHTLLGGAATLGLKVGERYVAGRVRAVQPQGIVVEDGAGVRQFLPYGTLTWWTLPGDALEDPRMAFLYEDADVKEVEDDDDDAD